MRIVAPIGATGEPPPPPPRLTVTETSRHRAHTPALCICLFVFATDGAAQRVEPAPPGTSMKLGCASGPLAPSLGNAMPQVRGRITRAGARDVLHATCHPVAILTVAVPEFATATPRITVWAVPRIDRPHAHYASCVRQIGAHRAPGIRESLRDTQVYILKSSVMYEMGSPRIRKR